MNANDLDVYVYVCDQHVGVLRENTETGLIDFEYLPGVPPELAVSLFMPPDAPPGDYQEYNGLPPPFEVSLPEGMVLEAIRSRFGKTIDVSSDLALLRLVGRHTVGRVTFGGPLEQDASLEQKILAAARTDHAAGRLAEILRSSPQMFGVSGVMPKMSVYAHDRLRPGTVIGHGAIIKFDSPNYTGASLVEYACLKACAAVGLDVPKVEISPDMTSIIVERFDIGADGRRRGFEDACALSGIRRTGKYSGTAEHLFGMIESFVHPDDWAADRAALLKLLVMNDVLRNGDAHLKNFGLVYDDVARPRLSPVFDVLTTPVWIRGDVPALAILKTDPGQPDHWLDAQEIDQLANLAGVSGASVRQMHADCAEAALHSMAKTLKACPPCPQRVALEQAIEIIAEAAQRPLDVENADNAPAWSPAM
ncbi:MAG: type II toxin-antitoxin system HipA family toxin [Burkholderiales bacterium]|nr:type II toxin-antitoxin system HipA family toxin [Burkholderiales bacterium]